MTGQVSSWYNRRKMAWLCLMAMLFQAFVLLPTCLIMILLADSGATLAGTVSSVGAWAGSLNIALGAIIATYTHQATKDDISRRAAGGVNGE